MLVPAHLIDGCSFRAGIEFASIKFFIRQSQPPGRLKEGRVVNPPEASPTFTHSGGPQVRVEFVRRSGCRVCRPDCRRGPLTLVLYEVAEPVPSLWARMTVDTLGAAVKALATRERLTGENIEANIGQWSSGQADPTEIPGLGVWARGRDDVDHVIWTALGPKFRARRPSDRGPSG